jgi:hypothetical protein
VCAVLADGVILGRKCHGILPSGSEGRAGSDEP